MTAQPTSPLPRPDSPDSVIPSDVAIGDPSDPRLDPLAPALRRYGLRSKLGDPPLRVLLQGLAGSLLMVAGGFGGGAILVRDPVLGNSPLSFLRYGHGEQLAGATVYLGLILLVWAWVRLGRDVLAHRVGGRGVLAVAVAWTVPMMVSVPLFTRDPYSYLAQGALPLAGFDPYATGPDVMTSVFTDNVHFFWQDTPAPYGPLFIMLAQGIASLVGSNAIAGVLLMRLVLVPGLVLLVCVLPALSRAMGGRPAVALWVAVANPVMVVHLVGGAHNDMLVVGLLCAAALLALRKRFLFAVALATLAMAVKATAGVVLPFLVLVWAASLTGPFWRRLLRSGVPAMAVFTLVFGACTLAAGFGLGWLPALSAPSLIVNYLSLPTGAGQLVHGVVGMFAALPEKPFIDVARAVGGVLLAVLLVRLWWVSREGGRVALRNAGIALVLAAVLAPTTLPWYLSWGLCLLATTRWSPQRMRWLVLGSVWLMLSYYPNGEASVYDWGFVLLSVPFAVLAAVSLLRRDPLRLRSQPSLTATSGPSSFTPYPLERPRTPSLVAAAGTEPPESLIDGARTRPS